MTAEVESRAAAALDRWASAMQPSRPSLDELLARRDAPVEALPPRTPQRLRRRWMVTAAAAVVLVAGVGAVIAMTRRGSSGDREVPPISQVTTETTATVPVADAAPTGFAPGSVPAGYRVSQADVWVPTRFEMPVTSDVWLRRGPDGAVTARLEVVAWPVSPNSTPARTGIPPDDDLQVHGQPAFVNDPAEGSADPNTTVSWEEGGLRILVTTGGDELDAVAIAELTHVGGSGVTVPDAAVPDGFERVPHDHQTEPGTWSTSVVLATDDAPRSISVTSRPNSLGQTIDAFAQVGAPQRTIGGRQVVVTTEAGGSTTAAWIEHGYIVGATAPDETTLTQLVATVEPVNEAAFDDLADQAAVAWQTVPEQDAVVFPDGLRVALHVTALQGDSISPAPPGAICVEADRVRCDSRSGMTRTGSEPWTLAEVEALITVDGRAELLVWVHHPATEIRRVADIVTGEAVSYEAIPADRGVFVRIAVPDGMTTIVVATWIGDGDRSVGGSGFSKWLDTSRQQIVTAVSTSEIEPPAPTGFFLPTTLPEGFVVADATAQPPDLTVHDPISQDYWVRRNESETTDWLSVIATRSDGGAIAAADANLTINELPASLQTDAAGLTTLTWYESDQRITATSTIEPAELASAVEFVAVDADGGGASLVTPAAFEHVDRTAAIVAADPLAVSTTVELEHSSGATVSVRTSPNTNGASFEMLPPRGELTYTAIGADPARITHLPSPAGGTTVEWVTNGFLVEVSSTGVDDETLLAIAAGIAVTDRARFEAVASGGD